MCRKEPNQLFLESPGPGNTTGSLHWYKLSPTDKHSLLHLTVGTVRVCTEHLLTGGSLKLCYAIAESIWTSPLTVTPDTVSNELPRWTTLLVSCYNLLLDEISIFYLTPKREHCGRLSSELYTTLAFVLYWVCFFIFCSNKSKLCVSL